MPGDMKLLTIKNMTQNVSVGSPNIRPLNKADRGYHMWYSPVLFISDCVPCSRVGPPWRVNSWPIGLILKVSHSSHDRAIRRISDVRIPWWRVGCVPFWAEPWLLDIGQVPSYCWLNILHSHRAGVRLLVISMAKKRSLIVTPRIWLLVRVGNKPIPLPRRERIGVRTVTLHAMWIWEEIHCTQFSTLILTKPLLYAYPKDLGL